MKFLRPVVPQSRGIITKKGVGSQKGSGGRSVGSAFSTWERGQNLVLNMSYRVG